MANCGHGLDSDLRPPCDTVIGLFRLLSAPPRSWPLFQRCGYQHHAPFVIYSRLVAPVLAPSLPAPALYPELYAGRFVGVYSFAGLHLILSSHLKSRLLPRTDSRLMISFGIILRLSRSGPDTRLTYAAFHHTRTTPLKEREVNPTDVPGPSAIAYSTVPPQPLGDFNQIIKVRNENGRVDTVRSRGQYHTYPSLITLKKLTKNPLRQPHF